MKKYFLIILVISTIASCNKEKDNTVDPTPKPEIEQDESNCIEGDLDTTRSPDMIIGEWQLIRSRIIGPEYQNFDLFEDSIIYSFQADGILSISGVGSQSPHSLTYGEYTYELGYIEQFQAPDKWVVTIYSTTWDSEYRHRPQGDLMILTQEESDGFQLCFEKK